MGIRLRSLSDTAKQLLKYQSSFIRNRHHHAGQQSTEVPKGHVAVYVGDQTDKTRFLVPVSFLNHPSFQGLLRRAEEEFGFSQPDGGLMIPCREEAFIDIMTSQIAISHS